jgi:hypothetical protein
MSFDVAWLRIQVIGTVQGQVRGKRTGAWQMVCFSRVGSGDRIDYHATRVRKQRGYVVLPDDQLAIFHGLR